MARGGRKDRPIDREQGPVAEFADDLRQLRGALTLEEIGRRMKYHPSTLSRRLSPNELPPRDFVESYVRACGADPEPWNERWLELHQNAADPQVIEPIGASDRELDRNALDPQEIAPTGAGDLRTVPWWQRPLLLVPAAAMALAVPVTVYLLLRASPSLGERTFPEAAPLASPTSGPPEVDVSLHGSTAWLSESSRAGGLRRPQATSSSGRSSSARRAPRRTGFPCARTGKPHNLPAIPGSTTSGLMSPRGPTTLRPGRSTTGNRSRAPDSCVPACPSWSTPRRLRLRHRLRPRHEQLRAPEASLAPGSSTVRTRSVEDGRRRPAR
ncbi:helix-turn-helix domain-containing protein [Nonomuraea sp. NPDC059194]|uniref:helix-turn-helix domain-containing protein n=1 Tax=Nonomuraea sp. NPDC059194 TaxID=3346764 RepID=UPI0036C98C27